jgi:hypothetical protein
MGTRRKFQISGSSTISSLRCHFRQRCALSVSATDGHEASIGRSSWSGRMSTAFFMPQITMPSLRPSWRLAYSRGHYYNKSSNVALWWLVNFIHVREPPFSNLDLETWRKDRAFSSLSIVSPHKWQDISLNRWYYISAPCCIHLLLHSILQSLVQLYSSVFTLDKD